ncbi:Uncharacterized membrane protein YgdD, TMEM256/DUF423 family [Kaistia soli DSM 19436]|uniref:Uncharacterized membrane protein YgdD, TMEM256/DUF423 family n=1 Tax=Kaistia soli DSM 19436 TaxID=1122133 RepID=A0A1M4Z1I2_9HYPH|nr:DUF423 domain-containing protein [Kaistia soli]SHF11933.1 Uncharacterized membrane protein YgdD, TMEM256/DUF423 family [Kaistia soli DSM 19436]
MDRALLLAAGLAGALGVALAAAGAHIAGADRLATAGQMAMAQAPALLALGLYGVARGRIMTVSAAAIALGLLVFAGALAFHDLTGSAALAFAAPWGGTAMILGWLGIGIAALAGKR